MFAILLFALLPPLVLVMPAVATAPDAGDSRQLIVWLPQDRAGDLAAASTTLDAADARPLAESRLTGVWLVAVRDADAADRSMRAAPVWSCPATACSPAASDSASSPDPPYRNHLP